MAEKEQLQTPPSPSPSGTETGIGSVVSPRQNIFQRLIHRRNDPNELGREMLQRSLQLDQAQLEADAIKVRRKLDFIVLPMMCCTYMLSFLDKQTLNYSNAYGLQPDTHMVGDDYSWVGSALYFGWLLGAWPWNILLQRIPIGKLIGSMLFMWGTVCMLQATAFNFGSLFAARFFLGMLEACVSPAWVMLTSMLWTRREQTLRSSIWLCTNGVSSILGALLAYGSGMAEGLSITSWKLIFLIVGALTFIWGFIILLYLPDGPHNAKMLTDHQRLVAVWRVSKNQMGLKHPHIKRHQIREALLADPKCYLVLLTGAGLGVVNGAVTTFMSTLIKSFGFDALRASLLQAPGGAVEVVACLVGGWTSQFRGMLGVSIMVGSLAPMAALVGIMTIPLRRRYALVAMTWLLNSIGSQIILSWTIPGVNVAGHTKRTTVMGIYFVFFVSGNIVGPHLFLSHEAPRYPTAIKALLGTYCAVIALQGAYTAWCWVENKRRDKLGMRSNAFEEELFEGFEDLTDMENKHFRYTL